MRRNFGIWIFFIALVWSVNLKAKKTCSFRDERIYFIENSGQVKDQNGNQRNDIQYVLQSKGIAIFIGKGQLHYQFLHVDECIPEQNELKGFAKKKSSILNSQPPAVETYRMDVELLGANKNAKAIVADRQEYYENYYVSGCPGNGIHAQTFKRITYENVYPGIDWVLSIAGDKLEYEFVVKPGGNAADIRMKYKGQTDLEMGNDGSITATTPMGSITEHAPVCYTKSGYKIKSAFRLKNNLLCYDLGEYEGALVIDPVLEWGTYYSEVSDFGSFCDISCDNAANVYACGYTYCSTLGTIATTGSYQDTYGENRDAFLVKFDSSGHRLWATYYGGSGTEEGAGVAFDHAQNIYLTGGTSSSDSIATPGSQQFVYGGGANGFLAKFDTAGFRQWATYIGGPEVTVMGSVSCDSFGHVYVSGVTEDNTNIASPGSFQPLQAGARDCFLIQYNAAGQRLWGTYYGGGGDDFGGVNCNDGLNVYLNGWTLSTTNIASPLCYQPAIAGSNDAFLAKFDSSGYRDWGTYYGGKGQEITGAVTACKGFVYLLGTTQSDSSIASPGSFQTTRGGMEDAFLVQFDTSGSRKWGTYYGGPGSESVSLSQIAADDSGNVYITGITNSNTGISSADAWKATYSATVGNAFLAKFDSAGTRKWSTYYGGTGDDKGFACAFDGNAVYICGQTNSTDSIATPDGFLPAGGGSPLGYQGFLAKFENVDPAALYSGMSQINFSSLHIYPSPNNGSFTLDGIIEKTNGTADIIITDVAGQVVMKDNALVENGIIHKKISLSSRLPPGEYLLKVASQNNLNLVKFLKE